MVDKLKIYISDHNMEKIHGEDHTCLDGLSQILEKLGVETVHEGVFELANSTFDAIVMHPHPSEARLIEKFHKANPQIPIIYYFTTDTDFKKYKKIEGLIKKGFAKENSKIENRYSIDSDGIITYSGPPYRIPELVKHLKEKI